MMRFQRGESGRMGIALKHILGSRKCPAFIKGIIIIINRNNNSNNYNNMSLLDSEKFLSKIRADDRLRIILEQTSLCFSDPEEASPVPLYSLFSSLGVSQ